MQLTIQASSILSLGLLLLTRSAQASFYVCTGENFKGDCQNFDMPYNDCYNLDAGYARRVTSAGPDEGS
ncbi:unnamed protein product [Sordaria macrospora k-hell]|uniref:WGS project CABT00000000 data, contig 2.5 n=1 Tax=Sordaria macrospora (strain ATCC MYA-333 / DSM 997 / K(L3346) / K-hell) TaxID=771870 RepID=F7VS19_SORMK|nr:uncharacterized protein SMAC_01853 [Sordaria macrospora k-hell]CCC08305.1 unnamed protein product [Sordaria macrospora k-hell]